MKPEILQILSALLVGGSLVAAGLDLFKAGRWRRITIGARIAAVVTLSISLILAVIEDGWSPFDRLQVMLGLCLVVLSTHLILTWRLGIDHADPVIDVVSMVLILAGIAIGRNPDLSRPATQSLTCLPYTVPVQAQWALFIVGGGSVLVAGTAGLSLALRWALARRRQGGGGRWTSGLPNRNDSYRLLTQSIFLALVALGGGLTIGVWWAWQTVGLLSGGSLREVWMAVASLFAAMSLLAWQLDGHRGRWSAGLAVVAAAAVLCGLLIPLGGQFLVGA